MSALQDSVTRRRLAESPDLGSVVVQPQASALVVCQWRGPSWVLPWSHLTAARCTPGDDSDQIELTFTQYVVLVTGVHLHPLVEDVAAFRVACLRELPADYRAHADSAAPFVHRIEVRTLASGSQEPSA